MTRWRFTIHIKSLEEFTDDLANALYESGCSRYALASSNCRSHIRIDRESLSLQTAIRSAIHDVRRCGLDVDSVEIEEQDLIEEELLQWPAEAAR